MNELRDDSMPLKFSFIGFLEHFFSTLLLLFFLLFLIWNVLVVDLLLIFLVNVLVDQGETDVVFKLCDREKELVLVLEQRLGVEFDQKVFGEGSNHTLFIVIYHVLEKLVDKFNLEIRQIKACIIIAVELVREI